MWDAFQHEALTALGHVVYRTADAPPLLGALMRAAGVPAERLSGLPPLEQLRSAAAKRALWPRLRALRAASRR